MTTPAQTTPAQTTPAQTNLTETLCVRPRVEGEREQEVLAATLRVLAEVGYDRLTMDAVAQAARASKATLYRRWNGKLQLVIDALKCVKSPGTIPDTGSLRGDLIASFCAPGGIADAEAVTTLASVVTAMSRDVEFARAFRREVVGPKAEAGRLIFERARARGEVRSDLDVDLLAPAVVGIVLHRHFVLGETPDESLVTRVVDQIVLPAVRPREPRAPLGAPSEFPPPGATAEPGASGHRPTDS